MQEQILFLNMFSDYQPQEDLGQFLLDAQMLSADIDPAERRITVKIGSDRYIPDRVLEQVRSDICSLYELRALRNP